MELKASEFQADVKLNAQQVREACKRYVENEMDVTATDVDLEIGTQSVGYGPQEHDETVFKGAIVKVKMGKKATQTKPMIKTGISKD